MELGRPETPIKYKFLPMRIVLFLASGLLCGSLVSGFSHSGLPLKRSSISGSSCRATAIKSSKTAITARFQTDAIDRRSLLLGTIFSAAVGFNKQAIAAETEEQYTAALLELSNQVPYEDKAVAFLSDGSPAFALAEAAFTKLGGTAVRIDPKKSVAEIQKIYMEGNCIGAFVTDEKVVKNIMQGRGCECERCGIGGSQTGPSWLVVLGKTSKTGQQIEEESGISGRECSKDGLCFQIGKGVPVYTKSELFAYRFPEEWRAAQ